MENSEGENIPHPNLKLLAKDKDYEYKEKIYPRRIHFGKRIPVGGEIIDIRKPLNTIICTYSRQPRFFVPLKNKNGYYLRCLLPDELKQIQGFPTDYKISGDNIYYILCPVLKSLVLKSSSSKKFIYIYIYIYILLYSNHFTKFIQ